MFRLPFYIQIYTYFRDIYIYIRTKRKYKHLFRLPFVGHGKPWIRPKIGPLVTPGLKPPSFPTRRSGSACVLLYGLLSNLIHSQTVSVFIQGVFCVDLLPHKCWLYLTKPQHLPKYICMQVPYITMHGPICLHKHACTYLQSAVIFTFLA